MIFTIEHFRDVQKVSIKTRKCFFFFKGVQNLVRHQTLIKTLTCHIRNQFAPPPALPLGNFSIVASSNWEIQRSKITSTSVAKLFLCDPVMTIIKQFIGDYSLSRTLSHYYYSAIVAMLATPHCTVPCYQDCCYLACLITITSSLPFLPTRNGRSVG